MAAEGVQACMPPNFSWVIDGLLASLGYPRSESHYLYLKEQQVDVLVSLTFFKVPSSKGNTEIDVIHIGMHDFTAPSLKQVDEFITIVDEAKKQGKRVAVHCKMGRGRTGTMLACYLVHHLDISSEEAISKIRVMRPGSIETSEQELLVHQYAMQTKQK